MDMAVLEAAVKAALVETRATSTVARADQDQLGAMAPHTLAEAVALADQRLDSNKVPAVAAALAVAVLAVLVTALTGLGMGLLEPQILEAVVAAGHRTTAVSVDTAATWGETAARALSLFATPEAKKVAAAR
jgi:hypothetical protein